MGQIAYKFDILRGGW